MKEMRMIKVVGVQKDAKGVENKIELITEGSFYEKKEHLYIVYEETEISGMEGSTTTLKIEGLDKVSMQRFGKTNIKMVFQVGKTFKSQYKTQYGDFQMEIFTKTLDIALCDKTKKGNIFIEYDLWVEGLTDTDNQLNIQLM